MLGLGTRSTNTKVIAMIDYQSTLLGRTEVAEGTMAFQFEKPKHFVFKAGQYIDLTLSGSQPGLPNGLTHTFSIASSPCDEELVVTTRIRDTVFKQAISILPIGSRARIEGPMGSFSLHKNTARPAVFLAGGIGIAPFLSMLSYATSGEAAPSYCSVLRKPLPGGCRVHRRTLEVRACKSKVPLCSDPHAHGQELPRLEGGDWTHQPGNASHTRGNLARPDLLHSRATNDGCGGAPNAQRGWA